MTSRDPYQLLLPAHGVERLPVATPFDLARLPIVRAVSQLEKPGTDGRLPMEAYETRFSQLDPQGVRHEVVIRGSPTEGLPYGRDGNVLIALFSIIAQHRHFDGVIHQPTLRMIARALGRPMHGGEARRIRDALSRFASVVIETRTRLPTPEEVEAIRTGRTLPRPPALASATERVVKIKLLDLAYESGRDDGADHLEYLAVNPVLLDGAIAGWVAWIDVEAYESLGGTATARRLYELFASEIARGRPPRWAYDLLDLRDLLGMAREDRPARIRARVQEGLAALCETGVLSIGEISAEGRGRYRVEVEPGPLLGVARLLRGVGLQDLRETQKQLLLLGAIGVTGTSARNLIRQSPEDVVWALTYLLYAQETGTRIKSPAGFVVSAVKEGINLAADAVFMQWYDRKLLGAPAAAQPTAPAPPVLASRPPAPPAIEPRDAAAAEVWPAILEAVLEEYGSRLGVRHALDDLTPYAVEETTLVLATANSFYAELIRTSYTDAIGIVAGRVSDGRIDEVRIEFMPD